MQRGPKKFLLGRLLLSFFAFQPPSQDLKWNSNKRCNYIMGLPLAISTLVHLLNKLTLLTSDASGLKEGGKVGFYKLHC